MKLFGYIFSFYILILGCAPCADTEGDYLTSDQHITLQMHDKTGSEQHNEACSPFCICACCGYQVAFNILPASIRYTKSFEAEKQFSICNQSLISNYYVSIWQPPKLS